MNVNDVINFLEDAKKKTFSENEKYYLSKAIITLYDMKYNNCFK